MKIKLKSLKKLGKTVGGARKKLKGIREKVLKKFPKMKQVSDKISNRLNLDKALKTLLPKLLGKGGALKNADVVGLLDGVLKGVKLPKDLEKVIKGIIDQAGGQKEPRYGFEMGMPPPFRLAVPIASDELKNVAELAAKRQAELLAA